MLFDRDSKSTTYSNLISILYLQNNKSKSQKYVRFNDVDISINLFYVPHNPSSSKMSIYININDVIITLIANHFLDLYF